MFFLSDVAYKRVRVIHSAPRQEVYNRSCYTFPLIIRCSKFVEEYGSSFHVMQIFLNDELPKFFVCCKYFTKFYCLLWRLRHLHVSNWNCNWVKFHRKWKIIFPFKLNNTFKYNTLEISKRQYQRNIDKQNVSSTIGSHYYVGFFYIFRFLSPSIEPPGTVLIPDGMLMSSSLPNLLWANQIS